MAPPQRPPEAFEAFKARVTTSASSSRPTTETRTSSSANANLWPALSMSSSLPSSSTPPHTSTSTSINPQNASQTPTTTQRKGKKSKFVPLEHWQESESGPSSAAPPMHPGSDSVQVPSWSRYPIPNASARGNRRSRGGPQGRNNAGRNLTGMMQKISLAQAQPARPIQGGPLTEFKVYMKLPTELRLKIYGIIYSQPRILEMSWADMEEAGVHSRHHLARRSRRAPAMMQVSREAREEGKEFYFQHVNFFSRPGVTGPISTWYNPQVDVILFGEDTCMRTLVHFLDEQHERGVSINQVAILLSGNNVKCHEDFAGLSDVTVMQALHGVGRPVTSSNMFRGVKGLKDVRLIVPTHLVKIAPGTIDDSIWFRPAVHDGMTRGQVVIKNSIEAEVVRVRTGLPLQGCGRLDNWTTNDRVIGPARDEDNEEDVSEDDEASTQENQHHNERPEDNRPPTFRFVSFTPAANAGEVFDSVPLSNADLPKFNRDRWEFMHKIERVADVHIKVPDRDFPGQMQREIGLWGQPEGIAKAKEMITKRIDDLKDKMADPKLIHRRGGYRSRGEIKYFGSGRIKDAAAAEY